MADLVERLDDYADAYADGSGLFDLLHEAAAEITRLRSQLAAAEAREAVMRGALKDATKIAWPWIDKHTGYPRLSWERWEQICANVDSALATPSPIADAMVAVVEAARTIPEVITPRVAAYCSGEVFPATQRLADALQRLDAANA